MTVYQVPEVQCDKPGCFEKYQLEDAPATPTQARKTAESEGWSRVVGGAKVVDFCPSCTDSFMLGLSERPEDDGD